MKICLCFQLCNTWLHYYPKLGMTFLKPSETPWIAEKWIVKAEKRVIFSWNVVTSHLLPLAFLLENLFHFAQLHLFCLNILSGNIQRTRTGCHWSCFHRHQWNSRCRSRGSIHSPYRFRAFGSNASSWSTLHSIMVGGWQISENSWNFHHNFVFHNVA